jgi:hypothetical protein
VRAVEAALGAGEVVKFEGAPAGWPRLSSNAMGLYLLLAAPVFLLSVAGFAPVVSYGKASVAVPLFLFLVPLIALVEFWRVASFRSTLYVVTDQRVLVLRGVFHVKPCTIFDRRFVEDVKLVDSEPALALEGSGTFVFAGLPAADADAIRVALGRTPMNLPVTTKPRRDELRTAIGALVVFIAAHVFGVVGKRTRDDFSAFDAKVKAAIAAVEAPLVGRDPANFKTGGGDAFYGGIFADQRLEHDVEVLDFSRRDPKAPNQPFSLVRIWVESTLPWGAIFYGPVKTVVRMPETAPLNDEALAALKKEFERAGIDAKWPEGVK